MRGTRVVVTELAPGFIDTDINRDKGARPFLIDVDKGAAIMARMIERQVGYGGAWLLAGMLNLPRGDRIAMLFAGAQKSVAMGAPLATKTKIVSGTSNRWLPSPASTSRRDSRRP